jgi:hypothetical protein
MSEIIKNSDEINNEDKKKYDPRIPKNFTELLSFSENVVKSASEFNVTDEESLKIVSKISLLKDNLTSLDAKQEKLKIDAKLETENQNRFFNELEEGIKELYRYIKYKFGPKSIKFKEYGIDSITNNWNLLKRFDSIVSLAETITKRSIENKTEDEESLRIITIIQEKKDALTTANAKQQRLINEKENLTDQVEESINELYITIRELLNYLEYKYGPKSDEIKKYGIKPKK